MLISEAFDLYKTNYLLIKGLSRRVLENNDYVRNRLLRVVGDKDIELLDMDDIAKWAAALTYRKLPDGTVQERKQNTIRNDLIRVKSILQYLKKRGVDCLDAGLIPVPKREEVVRPWLTPEEVEKMIDNAYSIRNKFVISLFYSSGIRLSEFLSLNRDSIVDGRFTVLGKGKKTRVCFIDARTERLMHEYLATRNDDCEALVVSKMHKQRMTPTNVQLLIKNSAKRAGINKKVSPHILRHSFATNFVQNNGGWRHLSSLLGHANINTTMVYAHITDNDLEKQYRLFHTIETIKTGENPVNFVYYPVDNFGVGAYN